MVMTPARPHNPLSRSACSLVVTESLSVSAQGLQLRFSILAPV